jgi:phospholipid/cholesterol/gamma-HCH transport system substrate-binding protein
METRANFVMIGAFTVLSFVLTAIFAVWIANVRFDVSYSHYDVAFQGPVRGLQTGAEVHFNGIAVGEVVDLNLDTRDPRDVIAHIRVRANTPIKVDSLAQLDPAGLTGLNYIQILPGSEGAQLLRPTLIGQRPVIASRTSQLDRLFSGGEGVLQTTLETLAQVNKLLADDNIQTLTRTLQNIEQATAQMAARDGLVTEATSAARSLTAASADVALLSSNLGETSRTYNLLGQELVGSARTLTERSVTLIETSTALAAGIDNLAGGTEDVVGEFSQTLETAGSTLREIEAAAASLRGATSDFQLAARGVSSASGTIDEFFRIGVNQTLPDIARMAQEVRNTSMTYDYLGQQVAYDPLAALSAPPNRTVEWRK